MANTIPANNNTSLYNATGNATPIDGNISATNINASGNIFANGSITTNSNFVGNLVGNVTGNITLTGGNTEVIFNNNGVSGSSPAFTFNSATNAVSAVGNVSANYFLGNGALLTGITTSYGNSNVANFLPTYTGNLAGGNLILTGNIFYGNSAEPVGLGRVNPVTGSTSNNSSYNLTFSIPTVGTWLIDLTVNAEIDKNSAPADFLTMALFDNANVQVGNSFTVISSTDNSARLYDLLVSGSAQYIVTTTGAATYYANATSVSGINSSSAFGTFVQLDAPVVMESISYTGNLNFAGNITANAGNVTASNYLVGNNALITGNITTGGILTDNYYYANGAPILFGGTYGNANVANFLGTGFGSNSILTTGNVSAGNLITSGALTATGNVSAGNVITAGVVSATGNVTGNYFIGNGSQLTGIGSSYNDSNVATFLAAFGSNTVSTTGTVTAGNITGGNLLTAGVVSATGNITGAVFFGNGSQLTGLPAGYSNANVASYLLTANGNIGSGSVSGGTVPHKITTVDLLVDTATSVGLATLDSIRLNSFIGTTANSTLMSAGNGFSTNQTVSAAGNITGGNITTAGLITATGDITGGNITTAGLVTATGNVTGGNITTAGLIIATGNVTGGNITTAGLITATGNVSVGNLMVLGTNGRIMSDFGTSTIAGRTYFQTTGSTTTFTGAMPGVGWPGNAGTVGAAVTALNTTDAANAAVGGIFVAAGNATTGFVGFRSAAFGTATLLPIRFQFGPTEVARFDTNGNLAIANTAPVDKLAVTGTAYVSGNITTGNVLTGGLVSATGNVTTASFFNAAVYTEAALTAITGAVGQFASVSDSSPGGMLAFWDTTNARWSYVHDNSAV